MWTDHKEHLAFRLPAKFSKLKTGNRDGLMAAAGGGHNVTAEQWLHRPAAHIQQESSQANRIQDSKIRVTIQIQAILCQRPAVAASSRPLARSKMAVVDKHKECRNNQGSRLEAREARDRCACRVRSDQPDLMSRPSPPMLPQSEWPKLRGFPRALAAREHLMKAPFPGRECV